MRIAIPVTWTIVVLAMPPVFASPSAENWPQWRGPAGTGASSERPLPESWSDTHNIAWKTRLNGVGVSSPIVWGDRVFVTSQAGAGVSREGPRLGQGGDASPTERALGAAGRGQPARFLIEALNRVDGRRAWTFELAAQGPLPAVHEKHNLASPSPVTDGERVYALFGSGQVVAVDMRGRQVWTRNLAREYGPFDINWGHGGSPILHRGALIVLSYHESASYLVALDARTGRQLWKTDRPKGVLSYSTPVVAPGPKGDELIVNSTVAVEAYDPSTGAELWRFDEPDKMPIPVAMHHDGIIYLSRGYRSGPYMAIRAGGRGDISRTHVVWHVPTGAPYVSSLVYYDGLLYMAADVGVITCIDAATGARVWRERFGGIHTASPVAGDGKIYVPSESGETLVLRAGRTPEVLARNLIDGRVLASPAISGGRIFIRTDDHVVAVGK